MLLMEKISPSMVGKGGFAPIMRLSGAVGLGAGFVMFYQRSICRLHTIIGVECLLTRVCSAILWFH